MKLNFCIISGINYLAKAITMYESLLATGVEFDLYYVAFDKETLKSLNCLNYSYIIPISLSQIEDNELKAVKNKRKMSEYYFTLTPSIILYIIRTFHLNQCIYLDADLYFFHSPQILLDEIESKSVLITKHHPSMDVVHKEGKYCVQFLPFKNDKTGIEILEWWRARCIEWCYLISEDGKWADQGYLNDWPERFEHVHVLKHYGAVGPWNMALTRNFYEIIEDEGKPYGVVSGTNEKFPVVFFHFQGLRVQHNNKVNMASIEVPDCFKKEIYKPYLANLFEVNTRLNKILPGIDALGKLPKPKTIGSIIDIFKKEKTLKNIAQKFKQKFTGLLKKLYN